MQVYLARIQQILIAFKLNDCAAVYGFFWNMPRADKHRSRSTSPALFWGVELRNDYRADESYSTVVNGNLAGLLCISYRFIWRSAFTHSYVLFVFGMHVLAALGCSKVQSIGSIGYRSRAAIGSWQRV